MAHWVVLALDIAVKVALIALLVHAVANPDLPQYAGKAMLGRALIYSAEMATAYTDTLGDLVLGTLGGALGAAIVRLTSPTASTPSVDQRRSQ